MITQPLFDESLMRECDALHGGMWSDRLCDTPYWKNRFNPFTKYFYWWLQSNIMRPVKNAFRRKIEVPPPDPSRIGSDLIPTESGLVPYDTLLLPDRQLLFKILNELFSIKSQLQTMAVSQQDLIEGLATLDKDIQDEIARFTQEVATAIAAGKLPDGTVVLSQADAQALLDKVNTIDTAVKAAGNS